jgi:hypothetical protein
MTSGDRRGRGWPGLRDLQRQSRRNPCRCQRRMVPAFTSRTASRQRGTSPASRTSRPRSCGRKAGRLTLREATISCWRRKAFSASSSLRDLVRSTANPTTSGRGRVASWKTNLMACTAAVAAARSRRRERCNTRCDLTEGRRSHKLVKSGNLNDPGADETAGQHSRPRAGYLVFAIAPRLRTSVYAPSRARIVDSDCPLPRFLASPAPVAPRFLGGEGQLRPGLSGHPIIGLRARNSLMLLTPPDRQSVRA